MKMRWRRIVAILGVVTMIGSAFPVAANEPTSDPEKVEEKADLGEETLDEEETPDEEVTDEKTLETAPAKEDEAEVSEDAADEAVDEEGSDIVLPDAETPAVEDTESVALLSAPQPENIATVAELKPFVLEWSSTHPGRAVFKNPNNEQLPFVLAFYKDGKQIYKVSHDYGYPGVSLEEETDWEIEDNGTYTYKVKVVANGTDTDGVDYDTIDGIESVSEPFVYTRPAAQVEVPKNVTCTPTGVVSWSAVDNAGYYYSQLYYKSEYSVSGYSPTHGIISMQLSHDHSDSLASDRDYYVRVRAYSSNINKYAHSDWSAYLPVNTSVVADSVNEKLKECSKEQGAIEDVVSAVKDQFGNDSEKRDLQVAMQTSSETRSLIQDLENRYKDAMNVETSVDPGNTGISSVSLLGAILNATQSGNIELKMSKPDENTQKEYLPNTSYKNAVVLDLNLAGAGINPGNLAIPVTVTMKVPEGMNPSNMTILHYNADKTYEELPVRQNGDGTISFTVTHFSYFAFVEKEQASSTDSGSSRSKSKSKGSEDDTDYDFYDEPSDPVVYVEPWKPVTPDEIKRYSVVGREKPEFKVNAADSYSVSVMNAMQGKLCFDSFEAVMGDYIIGRTYNIFPAGKIAYKMDKKAKITLNVPKDLQKDNRTFKMICVTQNGQPIVLNDLDTDPKTITFETDTYYAFALIYKDAAVSHS